ncbi:hypothetical protein BJV38_002884 [Clostridium beijerinckii]|nr:hypothetical protein [Clostridium beijerinckii]NRT34529.1 hypothetical protein [Clostridium beijerinckii]NRT46041.1 hypothetical protein [Clostridium beijerinckii]NRZ19957.1 hypothetical protein [Clostridium beijerinckii]
MNYKDKRLVCKLLIIGIHAKSHRIYKKQIKRLNPLLTEELKINLYVV